MLTGWRRVGAGLAISGRLVRDVPGVTMALASRLLALAFGNQEHGADSLKPRAWFTIAGETWPDTLRETVDPPYDRVHLLGKSWHQSLQRRGELSRRARAQGTFWSPLGRSRGNVLAHLTRPLHVTIADRRVLGPPNRECVGLSSMARGQMDMSHGFLATSRPWSLVRVRERSSGHASCSQVSRTAAVEPCTSRHPGRSSALLRQRTTLHAFSWKRWNPRLRRRSPTSRS